MNRRNVVFILGIGRSGSTMLDLMLGSYSQGFSLGEISKLPEIFEKYRTPAALCFDTTFWQDTFALSETQQLAAGLSNHRLHRHIPLKLERWVRERLGCDGILNPYTLLFDKIGKPILIDSSKYPNWVWRKLNAREFRQRQITPYLVHLVRDGRAVLNSYLRAFPDWTVEEFAQRWLDNLEQSQQVYDLFPSDRKMRVRYEVLATETENVVRQICRMLEIPFEPPMLEYWKHEHHYIVGSRSARALIARYRNRPVEAKTQEVHGEYYQTVDLAIRLDQRWKQELEAAKLERFYELIGDRNVPFEWND